MLSGRVGREGQATTVKCLRALMQLGSCHYRGMSCCEISTQFERSRTTSMVATYAERSLKKQPRPSARSWRWWEVTYLTSVGYIKFTSCEVMNAQVLLTLWCCVVIRVVAGFATRKQSMGVHLALVWQSVLTRYICVLPRREIMCTLLDYTLNQVWVCHWLSGNCVIAIYLTYPQNFLADDVYTLLQIGRLSAKLSVLVYCHMLYFY
jgi:hypothetical protein